MRRGRVAQLGERLVRNEEAEGSNPFSSTNYLTTHQQYTGAHLRSIETPTADPAFLYQDILVAIAPERRINNGEPSLHAICLAALKVTEGETVVHVGAGVGYYTAIPEKLAGKSGSVLAYEIEQDLAQLAAINLSAWKNVSVVHLSGSQESLPPCDVIYVNAGATHPLDAWLDAGTNTELTPTLIV